MKMDFIMAVTCRSALTICLVMFFTGCGDETPANDDIVIVEGMDVGPVEVDMGPPADAALPEDAALPPYEGPEFEGEAVACERNPNIAALAPILNGGRTHPTGRGEQAAAYDPCHGRIILFGGNDFQPEECADFGPKRFQSDTWMYSIEHDNWARLDIDGPPARGRHRMVFDSSRKRMYMFGGRYREQPNSGNYTLFNELWAFDVNTDTWAEIPTEGRGPSPRSNTAMVYDYLNDQVVLYGGNTSNNGLQFAPMADTYILDLETMTWRQVAGDAPPRRLFHRMVMDGEHGKVVLYGGGHEGAFTGDFYPNVWAFDLETETWEEVWTPERSRGPDRRINPSLVEDQENGKIIMFAGHDETRVGHRNDVWRFDMNNRKWAPVIAGDSGADGEQCEAFCSCPADFVSVDVNSPERRQYHSFISIYGEQRAILFGGKGDCGYLDDTWSFGFEEGAWTEVEPAGQGEACKRTGQEGCTDLCY